MDQGEKVLRASPKSEKLSRTSSTVSLDIDEGKTSSAIKNKNVQASDPYYVLFLLVLVLVSHQWSRYLITYQYAIKPSALLMNGINNVEDYSIGAATGLTPSQYGMLVGFGYSMAYCSMCLVMGRVSDLVSRRLVLFWGIILWNLALMLQAISNNFWQLLASRLMMGVGQAFSLPACYGLISIFFKDEDIASANGIFNVGLYVGLGMGSMSLVMTEILGWRTCTLAVSGLGIALSVFLVTIREPERAASDHASKGSKADSGVRAEDMTTRQAFLEVLSCGRTMRLVAACNIRVMGFAIISTFLPVYFTTSFPQKRWLFSALNTSIMMFAGAGSSYIGGMITSKWEHAGAKYAPAWVAGLGSIAALPFLLLCILSTNFHAAIAGLVLEFFFSECWSGCFYAMVQNTASHRVQGIAVSLLTITNNMSSSLTCYIIGLGFETAEGFFTNFSGITMIRVEMLLGIAGSYLISALFLFASRRYILSESNTEDEKSPLILTSPTEDLEARKR